MKFDGDLTITKADIKVVPPAAETHGAPQEAKS